MKEKSSLILPLLLVGEIIIASVVRFFQYVSIVEFDTGFFMRGSDAQGMLIYIVIAVSLILIAAAGFICKKRGESAFYVSPDGLDPFALKAIGFGLIAAGILMGFGISFEKVEISTAVRLLASLCTVIAGAVIIGRGEINIISGHILYASSALFYLTAALYYVSDNIILNHSDNLLVLLVYISYAAFLPAIARFINMYETEKTRLKEIIIAGFTVFLSGLHILSKVIAYIFGGSSVSGMSGIDPLASAAGLSTLCFMIALFTTKKNKEIIYLIDEDEYDEYLQKQKEENKATEQ